MNSRGFILKVYYLIVFVKIIRKNVEICKSVKNSVVKQVFEYVYFIEIKSKNLNFYTLVKENAIHFTVFLDYVVFII